MQNMGKFKLLLQNTIIFAINAVATKFISFFLVPLYTSFMSAGEYGITDMSLTVITLVAPLFTLSISDAALRFIVDNKNLRNYYTAISFAVTLFSIFIVIVFSPLLDLNIFGGLGKYKLEFIIAYATSALMNLCAEIARAIDKVKLVPICAITSSLVTFICACLFIGYFRLGILGYFISISTGPCFASIIYLFAGNIGSICVDGLLLFINGNNSMFRKFLRKMLHYSLPLIPNALFWWAQTSVSRFFVTGMIGIAASGMYAAASKLPGLLNTVYGIFQQAWQLSAFQEAKREGVERFYQIVFTVLQAGIVILCAFFSFCSPWIAGLLLRGETYNSWPLISILLLANLMNVFNSFYGTIYTSTMHTSYIMKTTMVGAVCCIVLTPVLISAFNIFGACIASFLSQFLVFILRAVDSRRYIYFKVEWQILIPTIIILFVQCMVTSFQISNWQIFSFLCLIIIIILELIYLKPLFFKFISKYSR